MVFQSVWTKNIDALLDILHSKGYGLKRKKEENNNKKTIVT